MSQSHAPLASILLLRESERVRALSLDFTQCPSLRDQALAVLKRLVADESRGFTGSLFVARRDRVDILVLFERPVENAMNVAQLIDVVAGEVGFEPLVNNGDVKTGSIDVMRDMIAPNSDR